MGIEIKAGESFKEIADRTPTGAITAFGGETAPTGWLTCDGSAVSRITYAELFSVIGVAFGNGDGVNSFHLPDFRGRFLRGRDGGAARDPDASTRTAMTTGGNAGDEVGSVQTAVMKTHTHSIEHNHAAFDSGVQSAHHHHNIDLYDSMGAGAKVIRGTGTHSDNMSTDNETSDHTHEINVPNFTGSSGSPSTDSGNETRPVNAYVNYIIKF